MAKAKKTWRENFTLLESEGHTVIVKGKKFVVRDFEKPLMRL